MSSATLAEKRASHRAQMQEHVGGQQGTRVRLGVILAEAEREQRVPGDTDIAIRAV
ncbi:hypothetical protein LZC95_50200 [Pendulispora brunnea]|uniref:Uncharacterized protein n=1 Tax=Pendulispora brunnea TaxID=2905690 RepID=A0ABZ2K7B1_9BACT